MKLPYSPYCHHVTSGESLHCHSQILSRGLGSYIVKCPFYAHFSILLLAGHPGTFCQLLMRTVNSVTLYSRKAFDFGRSHHLWRWTFKYVNTRLIREECLPLNVLLWIVTHFLAVKQSQFPTDKKLARFTDIQGVL